MARRPKPKPEESHYLTVLFPGGAELGWRKYHDMVKGELRCPFSPQELARHLELAWGISLKVTG